MRTQVVIIGAGPSGLLLSELLAQQGITTIILEKKTRLHILTRIRAGVLEPGSVAILSRHGLARRLQHEGKIHTGFNINWANSEELFIDVSKHTSQYLTTYGQVQLQEDLFLAADERQTEIIYEVAEIKLFAIDSTQPQLEFLHEGRRVRIKCDFIAGCDGFHGVARSYMEKHSSCVFAKTYPFSWLGVLAPTPPLRQITYSLQARGFALASMRNANLSRYYIQVPNATKIINWSEQEFWPELQARFPNHSFTNIDLVKFIEKSITKLRSCLINPIQLGRLFLVGDAAHLLPPTGAKGLNLAIADANHLAQALKGFYGNNNQEDLANYSDKALKRAWSAQQIADYLTNLLHRFPTDTEDLLQQKYQQLTELKKSPQKQAWLAQRYVSATESIPLY